MRPLLVLGAAALLAPAAFAQVDASRLPGTAPASASVAEDGGVPLRPALPDAQAEDAPRPAAVDELSPVLSDPADGGVPGALDPDPSGPRFETVVVGERQTDVRRIAGSAQVIGQQELDREESNDPHRILQAVPGVYARDEEGFGLRPNIGMRGVNPDRSSKITLMEDGVLAAPAPYSAPAAYNMPLVTRMAAVEIFKGPASIRFGPQTIGGAVNFLTMRVPHQPQADLDVSVGNYGGRKVHGSAAWGNERFGLLVEGVDLRSTGFKRLQSARDTGFDKSELMLKARAATAPSNRVAQQLSLKLEYGRETSNETYLGLSYEDFLRSPYARYPASEQDRMTWWRSQAQLTWDLSLGEAVRLTTTAYRNDFKRNWHRFLGFRDGPDVYSLLAYPAAGTAAQAWVAILSGDEDSQSPAQSIMVVNNARRMQAQGVQSAVTVTGALGPSRHELEVGARLHSDGIRRDHIARGFQMVRRALVWDGLEDITYAANNGEAQALSAHVADAVSFGPLTIVPGARVELIRVSLRDDVKGTTQTNGSLTPLLGLGAVYGFDEGLTLLAGTYQGFSPVAPGGGPEVKPESSLNTEGGFRYSRRGTRAEVVGFWSEYSNITGECTFATGCVSDAVNQQFDGGAARVVGVEVLGATQWRAPLQLQINVDLAYTFTSTQFLTAFSSANPIWGTVRPGDELPYVPAHQGQIRGRVQRGPLQLGVGLAYLGEMREVAGLGPAPDAVRIPQRVLLDATFAVDLPPARFYATATNLLQTASLASRHPLGARPIAPLLFQLGFKYAFR